MRDILTICFVCTSVSVTAYAKEGIPGWELLRSQALSASQRASYGDAEELLRSALASLPGPTVVAAVTLWNELGEAQQAQGRLIEAEQAYRHAITINRGLRQLDDFDMAASLNDLAAISHA